MVRLTIRPSQETALAPVDVEVAASPDGRVSDLAAELGRHLAGEGSQVLLAPASQGRLWSAAERLRDTGLRDGDVLEVQSVPQDWLDRPVSRRVPTAVVDVVAGPDAGRSVRVYGDALTVGRGSRATVRLCDPTVSRDHARVLLSATPVVIDQGSAHGTRIAGREVTGAQQLGWEEPVELGRTRLILRRAQGAASAARQSAVLRSPRFGDGPAAGELEVPSAPPPLRRLQFPWLMMLMPLVMGAAMMARTRSPYLLIFMVGMPTIMALSHLVQARAARKDHAAEVEAWQGELAEVLATLDAAAATQCAVDEDDAPDVAEVLSRAAARHHRLWVRRADDEDFLSVRVGRGPRPALLTAKVGAGGDRALRGEARELVAARATLAGRAVPVDLGSPLTAVVGDPEVVDDVVRALVVRLATDHSPTDVTLAAALGRGRAEAETWLRWLPHADALGEAPIAVGAAEGQALLERLAAAGGPAGHAICLVDEGAGLPRRLVEAIAAARPDTLHIVWLGRSVHEVPAATAAVVDTTQARIDLARRGGTARIDRLDRLELVGAWNAARALTSYRDEAAVAAAEALLPASVRLPDISGDLSDLDDPTAILARWSISVGLRAQIGAGVDGPVTIDLREDGPHGLVAGTTGSGKSELLQTLICSLAMNNPPARITFLLVDYKGGAAFRECADLPHTVGYITDLTPALVERALVSLHAELTAREHLLAQYGAKDLPAMERSHPDVAPPAMLICVDEFAALLAEVPQFVDGMVSIAQRGRSLGMHMLLATQRPAGVVTPQIKANTDLRIALRVASTDDSADVIDAPDAADLSRRTPGRAWLRRTGHGTRELVQVAWVGAHERMVESERAVQVRPFSARPGGRARGTAGGVQHGTCDLERMVRAVTGAFDLSDAPPPRLPWLPPLPAGLDLHLAAPLELRESADAAGANRTREPVPVEAGEDGVVVLGLVDRPAEQAQFPWRVEYPRIGHMLVFGASGSGKTELLRTLVAAACGGAPGKVCVYGIDAGGGGLAVLEGLPAVGSVVIEQQRERVLRLVRMVHRAVTERNAVLAARGAADVRALAAAGLELPRLHLIIDNLPALLESFEGGGALRRSHADMLLTVLQEGRRCGVHVTATAPQRTGLSSQIQACFGERVVLRMAVDDDYAMLGVPGGVLDRQSAPGRGLVGAHEVQVATIGAIGSARQRDFLAALADRLTAPHATAPVPPVPAMPTRIPADLLPAPKGDEVCIGVEEDVIGGVTLRLADGPLLVSGRGRSGRTSFLLGVAHQCRRSTTPPRRILALGPRVDPRLAAAADAAHPDLVAAAAALAELGAGAPAEPAGAAAAEAPGGPAEGWDLVLIDDTHEWDRQWEAGGEARDALTEIAAFVAGARDRRIALVVTTDSDDARSRQHVPGLVAAVRRARRAILLGPEMGDGALVGGQVPMNSHEPMTGTGRGVLIGGGSVHVVQVLCQAQDEGVR